MKKTLFIFIAAIMLLSGINTFAADNSFALSYDSETLSFNVSGNTQDGSNAVLIVYGPDYNADTMENIYYAAEQDIVSSFSFTVPMDRSAKRGMYTFQVSVNGRDYSAAQRQYNTPGFEYSYSLDSFSLDKTAAAATFSNITSGEVSTPVLIAVVYDSETDKLISTKIEPSVKMAAGTSKTLSITNLGADGDGCYAKAFLVTNLDSVKPVTGSITCK